MFDLCVIMMTGIVRRYQNPTWNGTAGI